MKDEYDKKEESTLKDMWLTHEGEQEVRKLACCKLELEGDSLRIYLSLTRGYNIQSYSSVG